MLKIVIESSERDDLVAISHELSAMLSYAESTVLAKRLSPSSRAIETERLRRCRFGIFVLEQLAKSAGKAVVFEEAQNARKEQVNGLQGSHEQPAESPHEQWLRYALAQRWIVVLRASELEAYARKLIVTAASGRSVGVVAAHSEREGDELQSEHGDDARTGGESVAQTGQPADGAE